ncbi:MAG: hypothetical protein Devi2KO_30560 [Devosia indica]
MAAISQGGAEALSERLANAGPPFIGLRSRCRIAARQEQIDTHLISKGQGNLYHWR